MLIIGITGATIVLIAFILNQLGKLSSDSVVYDAANFVASVLLFMYSLETMAVPFLITNTVWGLFSLWGVLQYLFSIRTKKATLA
jgi:hypothetical protein